MKNFFQKLILNVAGLDKKLLIAICAGTLAVGGGATTVIIINNNNNKAVVEQEDNKKDEDTVKETVDETTGNEEETEGETEVTASFQVKVADADGNPVEGVVVQVYNAEGVAVVTDAEGISSTAEGIALFETEILEGYKLSVITCPEGYVYTGEDIQLESGATEYALTIEKSDATEGTEGQLGTTTKEDGTEVIGEGSKSNPIMLDFIGESMTVTTTSIPAGKEMYFGIYKIGNLILTINNPNAYVIESNGTRHDASNGKVSFQVENALASDAVYFTIGNKSSSATTFTIQRENPTGSFMNPTIIKTIGNDVKISLADGNEVGHYYKYIAEKSGTIRFYMTATVSSVMSVTNNRSSAQRTTDADALTDSQGKQYVELEVNQGDEIIIVVGAARTVRGKYPATTITWNGKYN